MPCGGKKKKKKIGFILKVLLNNHITELKYRPFH